MAKVRIKTEIATPLGGIFHVRELFSRYIAPIFNKVPVLQCTSYGHQSVRMWVHCQASASVVVTVWKM